MNNEGKVKHGELIEKTCKSCQTRLFISIVKLLFAQISVMMGKDKTAIKCPKCETMNDIYKKNFRDYIRAAMLVSGENYGISHEIQIVMGSNKHDLDVGKFVLSLIEDGKLTEQEAMEYLEKALSCAFDDYTVKFCKNALDLLEGKRRFLNSIIPDATKNEGKKE